MFKHDTRPPAARKTLGDTDAPSTTHHAKGADSVLFMKRLFPAGRHAIINTDCLIESPLPSNEYSRGLWFKSEPKLPSHFFSLHRREKLQQCAIRAPQRSAESERSRAQRCKMSRCCFNAEDMCGDDAVLPPLPPPPLLLGPHAGSLALDQFQPQSSSQMCRRTSDHLSSPGQKKAHRAA